MRRWGHEYRGRRQRYLLGKLKVGKSMPEFLKFLEREGFTNHFVAWLDPGQYVSLRKKLNFEEQYHLRIFKDGEVRGHYEKTPEAHPFKHFFEIGEAERRAELTAYLKDWIAPVADPKDYLIEGKTSSQSIPETSRARPRKG